MLLIVTETGKDSSSPYVSDAQSWRFFLKIILRFIDSSNFISLFLREKWERQFGRTYYIIYILEACINLRQHSFKPSRTMIVRKMSYTIRRKGAATKIFFQLKVKKKIFKVCAKLNQAIQPSSVASRTCPRGEGQGFQRGC